MNPDLKPFSLRKQVKSSKVRRPIRRRSKRMSAAARLYQQKRKWFLIEHPLCQVFKDRPATEIHHRKGRGKYLLDETTWLAVSAEAHRKIHDNPKWSYEKGYLLRRN